MGLIATDEPILSIFADAVRSAAQSLSLDGKPSFLEKYLEQELVTPLRVRLGTSAVEACKRSSVPDWHPQPGGLDLVVWNSHKELRFAGELKVEKVDETLWDVYKMAAVGLRDGVEATVVAIAATTKLWSSDKDCVAFFPPTSEPRRWESLQVFSDFRNAWIDLLAGGRGRPQRVPRIIEISFVAAEPLVRAPRYELRSIAVRAVQHEGWLEFDGDWPVGVSPPPAKQRQPATLSVQSGIVECAGYPVPRHLRGSSDFWLTEHVPVMSPAQYDALLVELRGRGWKADEIDARVAPHRDVAVE